MSKQFEASDYAKKMISDCSDINQKQALEDAESLNEDLTWLRYMKTSKKGKKEKEGSYGPASKR